MPGGAVLIAFVVGATVASVIAAILCRWLVRRHGETARIQIEFSRERSQDLERRLTTAEGAIADRDARLGAAQQEITRHKTEQATFAARIEELDRAHGALRDAFQALSLEALKSNGESFVQLARGEFEKLQQSSHGDLAKRQNAFDAMLGPIREGLEKYDEKLFDIERERTASYAKLETQLIHVSAASETLRIETASLAGALKSSTVRGTWGEVQLERCCELAGMRDRCDFRTQESVTTEDGRRRPDLVVQLPGNRTIVVDAKVPIAGYMEAVACDDPHRRQELLEQYAACVRGHMADLSKKAYWSQFDHSPEFVVLFLAAESFFSAALDGEPGLIEEGATQRVIIATPTTLIALLRAVALGWREERIAKSADEVSALGKQLYDRIRKLGGHFSDVGIHLGKSVAAFNQAASYMESRVLVSARRFEALGAGGGDPIEELPVVEISPNALSAPEFDLRPPTGGPSFVRADPALPLAS